VEEATLGMVLTPWAVLLLQVAPVGILLRLRDLTEAERRSIDQTSSDVEALWWLEHQRMNRASALEDFSVEAEYENLLVEAEKRTHFLISSADLLAEAAW
jgi:hypothetical protein